MSCPSKRRLEDRGKGNNEHPNTEEVNNVYGERNKIVLYAAALTVALGGDAGLRETDTDWPVVWMKTPGSGDQLAWHMPRDEIPEFMLERSGELCVYDGHTTKEKYARIDAFIKREWNRNSGGGGGKH